MTNKGIEIKYGDIAPEAKENFVPISDDSQFDTLSHLKKYNLSFKNYLNPCETYSVVLDGKAVALPSIPKKSNLGFWSKQISNSTGDFLEPVVLEFESKGQYSSQGITLTFDTQNDVYATRLSIKWVRITNGVATTLDEKEFYPNNSSYFCQNFVENYNKLVVTFYSLNMPKCRLKLRAIDYGYGTVFSGEELRGTKIIQEIDPLSTEISINTADFTIDSKSDMVYSFQERQPLNIYFNGKLKATTFVKSSKRKAKFLWDVQSEDYIGLMDSVPYYGGIYTKENATDILKDIFAVAKIPYSIDESFSGKQVTGYIPFTTCRDALMQVAFAIQAVVDTSDSEVVKIFKLEDETKQTITLDRIMQGQSFTDEEIVTGVEVTSHAYKESTETLDAYTSEESGTGDGIFVKFSEPLHDLSITNGEIVSSGTNFCIINASKNCVLQGKKYEHTTKIKRKNNPVVLASTTEKIVSIENATLVSNNNVDNILDKCYNWLIKTREINVDIVERKHVKYGENYKYGVGLKYGSGLKYGGKSSSIITYDEPINVGDKLNVETEYLGLLEGKRNIKQTFSLNGNILIKKAVLK